jgi:tetratricopeptide (TPR) repeat protein
MDVAKDLNLPAVPSRLTVWAIALAVSLLTFIVFYPAVNGEFVNFDDYENFVQNEANLRLFEMPDGTPGLNADSLKWILTAHHVGVYTPVSWLTVAIDIWIAGGLTSRQLHLTNVVLHSINALLVFFIFVSLFAFAGRGRNENGLPLIACALATLVFALHPLRVEIVAWASARNNLVGAFFALLSVLAYFQAYRGEKERIAWHILALLLYAVGMLAKAYVLPLPLVLLLLDWYPLRRFEGASTRLKVRILLEKVVWLALGLYLALGFIKTINALLGMPKLVRTTEPDGFRDVRLGIAAYSLWFSVTKTLLPLNLVAYLPIPRDVSPVHPVFLPAYIFAAVGTTAAFVLRKKARWFTVSWFAMLFLLGPVSGIVSLGMHLGADRYTYLATLPLAALAALALAKVELEWSGAQRALAFAAAGVLCGGLAYGTRALIPNWKDSVTLWTSVSRKFPDNRQVALYLGEAYVVAGEEEKGMELLNQAAAPVSKDAGRWLEVDKYFRSLALQKVAVRLGEQGQAEGDAKKIEEAIRLLKEVVEARPKDVKILLSVCQLLASAGRAEEAIPLVDRAIEALPELESLRQLKEELLAAIPPPPRTPEEAGDLAMMQSRFEDAIKHYRLALKENPDSQDLYGKLSQAFVAAKRYVDARKTLEPAVQRWPDNPSLTYSFLWLLATAPDPKARDANLGLEIIRRINGDEQTQPQLIDIVAAVYAEAGKFDKAIALLSRAIEATPSDQQAGFRMRLQLYQQGKPYRIK